MLLSYYTGTLSIMIILFNLSHTQLTAIGLCQVIKDFVKTGGHSTML